MDYELHNTAQPFLDLVRSHSEPYFTNVLDTEIIIYPGVMSPKYDWSSTFIVKNLPELNNKSVLEVGSGSGVLSLFAALRGAAKVTALDINRAAVKNTEINFARHNLDEGNFTVLYSDLFSSLSKSERYDYVIFNAPFHGVEAHDELEKSITDFQYGLSKGFFTEVSQYLKPEGKVLYAFGSMGDLELVKSFWESNAFIAEDIKQDSAINYGVKAEEDWICYLFTLRQG